MTYERTMSAPPKAIPAAPGTGLFVLAVALIPLIHLFFLLTGKSAVLDGFLPGPDSYMRLVRVEQLYQTGAWFDGTIPRSNWPYGEVLHWTRPADVMMLSGTLLLEPFLGFHKALYWWGSATAPLLHTATALALAWMVAPRFDRSRQFLVVLLFLVQIPVWQHGIFGRTDHHMLILLFTVLALGGALRVMVAPFRRRDGLLAGALAGFALWLTIESLVVLAVIFAAFTIRWLVDGASSARRYLWHGLGLIALVAVALLVERPPGDWFTAEYDRISAVHLLMAVAAAGFWAVAAALEVRGLADGVPGRVVIAALGGTVAAGLMALIYPGFFFGPFVAVSEELWAITWAATAEFQPLLPKSVADLGPFVMAIGPALIAVPYLAYRTWQAHGRNLTDLWLLIALGLLAYLSLTLAIRRFSPFAAILLGVVMADLVAHLLDHMRAARSTIGRLGSVGLLVVVVFGHIAVGGILGRLLAPSPAQARVSYCPMDVLIDELNRPEVVGPGMHAVLTTPNFGPMILYFTDHAVVTTLYWRNVAGELDAFRIYSATDWPSARQLIDQRGIDLIVVCITRETYRDHSDGSTTLDSRLRRGEAPDWLRPLDLGETAAKLYRIYRVSPGAE